MTDFSDLVGKTITKIEGAAADSDHIGIWTVAGRYEMYHNQSCCEDVIINDICGDIGDIIGSPILLAEEVSSGDWPDDAGLGPDRDSFTWTFYKISTIKGSVTIRWLGQSNGYYSEDVSFFKMDN